MRLIEMKTPKRYADVIKAWADGEDVQYRTSIENCWVDAKTPYFDDSSTSIEWRIKPEIYEVKYRLALMNYDDEFHVDIVGTEADADEFESLEGFVEWITDWKTYEIST